MHLLRPGSISNSGGITNNNNNNVIDNKVEILDYGNVDAIRAGIRDPKKIKEYMERLQREREGITDDPEADKPEDDDGEKAEEKPKEGEAPKPELLVAKAQSHEVQARATLFR